LGGEARREEGGGDEKAETDEARSHAVGRVMVASVRAGKRNKSQRYQIVNGLVRRSWAGFVGGGPGGVLVSIYRRRMGGKTRAAQRSMAR